MKMNDIQNKGFRKKGFTFVEIMITFTLFMILAGVGVGAYFRYYHFSLVNNDVMQINKTLHEARFRAMKNLHNDAYGVHLSPSNDSLIIFRDTYTPGDPENIMVELYQLEITNINLMPNPGVTSDIRFENKSGKTANSGSFTIMKDDFSYTYQINEQGAFE